MIIRATILATVAAMDTIAVLFPWYQLHPLLRLNLAQSSTALSGIAAAIGAVTGTGSQSSVRLLDNGYLALVPSCHNVPKCRSIR